MDEHNPLHRTLILSPLTLITPLPRRLIKLLLRRQRRHLVVIPRGRIELTYGADLIRRVTRDTDIPVALEDDLDVFDVKRVRAAKLRHFAGGGRDVVDEFVDKLEDGLVEGIDVSCDGAGIEY